MQRAWKRQCASEFRLCCWRYEIGAGFESREGSARHHQGLPLRPSAILRNMVGARARQLVGYFALHSASVGFPPRWPGILVVMKGAAGAAAVPFSLLGLLLFFLKIG